MNELLCCQMATVDFVDWLETELRKRNMRPSDLARKADLDKGIISRTLNRERHPSAETLISIARGLSLPHEAIFRAAGLLPATLKADDTLRRIEHLYHTLEDPDNKQKALEFLEFLQTSEERGNHDKKGKKS
jgi:transcriptional regulator with XRE-family HTH domain